MISGRTRNGLCAAAVLWVFSVTLAFAQNVVQRENAKPGTPGWQLASPADWPAIEGYASATSVNRGETISFHVSSYTRDYQITIYRVGWYGGAGARQVSTVSLSNGVKRAVPSPDPVTGLIECDWPVSHQITIPNSTDKTDWASGIYLAKLTPSGGDDSMIIFVVRDDSSQATYLYQSTATTSQAYNYWGGKSLYAFNSYNGPARKVSFNRPYGHVNGMGGAGNFFEWEVNFVRFVEREGYDVTYASNIDLHVNPNLLIGHKAFLTAGHDEYWSYQMRAAVQAAQARGVHLGFFAANEAYWQVRFEPSSTGHANRTMVAYKEAAQTSDPYATDLDKTNDKYITGRFRDLLPIFGVVDPIAQPENAFVGVQYHGDPFWGDMIVSDASSWVFSGTGVVNGTRLSGLLGYETDAIVNNGFSPATLQKIADSPDDWGGSHMATYTTATGSVVVATGSRGSSVGEFTARATR